MATETSPGTVEPPARELLERVQLRMSDTCRRLGFEFATVDTAFLAYLQEVAQFGVFSFGPVTIDVRLIEHLVESAAPHGPPTEPTYGDDYVRFSTRLMAEVRRTGARRVDELHFLLAFMRIGEGIPARAFGELGVSAESVEAYAHALKRGDAGPESPERLYSPEEAADYLGVHVQTVRAWIRTGQLRASRLAGKRALRIRHSDLLSVLEPLD